MMSSEYRKVLRKMRSRKLIRNWHLNSILIKIELPRQQRHLRRWVRRLRVWATRRRGSCTISTELKKIFNRGTSLTFMKKSLTLMIFSECSSEEACSMIEGTIETCTVVHSQTGERKRTACRWIQASNCSLSLRLFSFCLSSVWWHRCFQGSSSRPRKCSSRTLCTRATSILYLSLLIGWSYSTC